jgi:molybdopterin-synthase adenylyltransferase
MTLSERTRPFLPTHYHILYDAPDEDGAEALLFISHRRRIKVKGTMLREFKNQVLPLLDGRHSLSDIQARVSTLLPADSVKAGLDLLEQQGLIVAEPPDPVGGDLARLAPQLNFFHEMGQPWREVQDRLSRARVSVLGLGAPGAVVAAGLAAAGVGSLRLIDDLPVREEDRLHAPMFARADTGARRVDAIRDAIERSSPETAVEVRDMAIDSDEAMLAVTEGSDLVACCVDSGRSAHRHRLNRACDAQRVPWISCASAGFEAVVGPLVRPGDTPCHLCYTMRSVAAARDPEEEFGVQQFLDARRLDDSDRRESFGFSVALMANLMGLESLKALTQVGSCQTLGAVVVIDVLQSSLKRHVVLKNPRCPVCFPATGDAARPA